MQFVQRSGLGIRVIDENVGTGDDSNLYFDLDNDNIIAGSYTLSYAASGSNNFTALTETTHYTIPDPESGRIILTTAGKTALSTNILYATYWYTETFSNTVVTDLLLAAHDEVNLLTRKKWDTPTSNVEYRDGRQSLSYPTTDRPYQDDWDPNDFIVLDESPVTKVSNVYFLNIPQSIVRFWNYDAGTSTYTDKTDEVNDTTESPFTLFNTNPAVNDYIYVGSSNTFLGLDTVLSTVGTGSPAIDWEYYNGTSWVDLTETDDTTGASTFEASGKFTWTYPYGWSKTSVNGYSAYWVRGKLATGYTIDPIISTLTIKDSIASVVEPRQIAWRDYGRLTFIDVDIPNGNQNIRIDYNHGETTTPTYIVDLTILLASVKAYINLSGGSYSDATMYTLGSKSVSIGEVYVNIARVIVEFKAKIKEILDLIGRRVDLIAI